MNIENELQQYNVSRETLQKLQDFVALLQEWNAKMNLVSKKSLEDVWQRHVLDSIQLVKYLPQNPRCLVDIGSGAGFPGIVLAIVLQEKFPEAKVILVESITKKTVYLKDVCTKLGLTNTTVENSRIENISIKNVDVITARAVAALDMLCLYAFDLATKNIRMLFLKGRSYTDEVTAAEQKWKFNLQVYPNLYSSDGVVLELSNLWKIK